MAEPENLVLVLLREMREETKSRFDLMEQRLDRMEKRLDGMHLNGMKALKSFIGHRTMVERTFASFDDQVSRLEGRVADLESARA